MKRSVAFALVAASLVSVSVPRAFAEVPGSADSGWSFGGGVALESRRSGGSVEIGFPLVDGGDLRVRNHVAVNGWGNDDAGGALVVSDKLVLGGFHPSGAGSYAWIEGGAGLFVSGAEPLLDPRLVWDAKGGGGVEQFLERSFSFYAEIGGGASGPVGGASSGLPDPGGFALMRLGFRRYF